jgi:hypothetical protein
MRKSFTMIAAACFVAGCPKPQEAEQVTEQVTEQAAPSEAPTAMGAIQAAHDSLEGDCGKHLPEIAGLSELTLAEADQAKADEMLATIGSMAQSCAPDFERPRAADGAEGCSQDCHWCPVKWYWCIENAGACAGGDNTACCKLGACGSKHHCETVCKASCSCDVPPLPADGGGGDEE